MAKRRARHSRSRASSQPETGLYAPVKTFLERQGYTVKGEIGRCDVVALRVGEPPVLVELKTTLTLELLLQGIERLAMSDRVYLAVPSSGGGPRIFDRRLHKLLRRVGLGLLLVHGRHAGASVEAVLDPGPYRPRTDRQRLDRLLGEFARRAGDPNAGGSTRVKIVTAYRQEALRMASVLAARGPQTPALLRVDAEAPNAGRILLNDVYGWFERVERGVYTLTQAGTAALRTFGGRFAAPSCLQRAAPTPPA